MIQILILQTSKNYANFTKCTLQSLIEEHVNFQNMKNLHFSLSQAADDRLNA